MPPPIEDDKREAILTDIRAAQLGRNAIATKHDVSTTTVTKIAKQEGITGAFSREQTEKATRARQFDAKAARAQLIEDLYGDAQRFRARSWAEYTQVVSSPTGPELVVTELPPLRDQQAGYTALGIALDKAAKLEGVDAGQAAGKAKTMLGDLRSALAMAYDAMVDEPAQDAQDGVEQGEE